MAYLLPLGRVATVMQGINRHGRGVGTNTGPWRVRIVATGNIQDDRLVPEGADEAYLEEGERTERFLLYPGDLLIGARTTSAKAALVPLRLERTLADASLLVLRVRPELAGDGTPESVNLRMPLTATLWAYLTSPEGRARLQGAMVGTTIQTLHPRALADLVVPVPDPAEIDLVAELVEQSERAYVAALEAARARRALVRDLVAGEIGESERAGESDEQGAERRRRAPSRFDDAERRRVLSLLSAGAVWPGERSAREADTEEDDDVTNAR